MIPKMNFLDILTTCSQYFYKKVWGQDNLITTRICSLILGVKKLNIELYY